MTASRRRWFLNFRASRGSLDQPIQYSARRRLSLGLFRGVLRWFNLPIHLGGAASRRRVGAELCRIPYGESGAIWSWREPSALRKHLRSKPPFKGERGLCFLGRSLILVGA